MAKFSTLQINVASDQAAVGIQKHIPQISLFAKSFSGRPGQPYNGVAVPIFSNLSGVSTYTTQGAGASDLLTDKYCNGEQLEGAVIPLDKLFVKSYALTDYEVGSTDNLYLADGARAIGDQLGLEVANYVFSNVLSSSEITATTSLTALSDKAGFANLFAAAANAGANPYDCVLALDPTTFAKLLGTLDSYVYGGPEAIRNGVVPGLYGFRGVVCAPTLPTALSGGGGFIIPWESIGVASRWNRPAVDGYEASWAATDEKTGMAIGFRVFENLCKGAAFMAGDILFGAKLIQPEKIVKIA